MVIGELQSSGSTIGELWEWETEVEHRKKKIVSIYLQPSNIYRESDCTMSIFLPSLFCFFPLRLRHGDLIAFVYTIFRYSPACLPARRSVLPDTIVRIVSFAFWKNQCSHSHPVTFTYKSALICSIQHSLWWDFDFCTLVCDDFFCSVSFALLTLYHSTLSNGKCWIISYLHREYLHVSTPYNASATHSKFSLIPTQ